MSPLKHSLLFALLCLLPFLAVANESLHAYIAATHKTLFDQYNAFVLGDLSVAKAAFRGPIAVQGKAELADFDIQAAPKCDRDVRALTVAGTLTARMGKVRGGYTVLGSGSRVHHSVSMECTSRVERYDPRRNGDVEFIPLRDALIRESADMCVTEAGGGLETSNSTMKFTPAEEGFSCYEFFRIKTDDLRLINRWVYEGDYERNIVVVITGLRNEFRQFRMEGFNPRKTLIVFCAVYGSFGMYGARLQGSILAPAASLTMMDTIINGSVIAGGLRGSLAALHVPYMTC